MKKSQLFFVFTIIALLLSGCISNTKKTENLRSFAKAYGYVKYFHPGDEAADLDWRKFSAYGAREIEKCNSPEQVVQTLTRLFNPIAPSVRFSVSQTEPVFDMKTITPDDTAGYSPIYWQHQGVGTDMKMKRPDTYRSVRVNSKIKHSEKIFETEPQIGTAIIKNIGNNIYCQIPLVLYCNSKGTYPRADSISLKQLKTDLAGFDYKEENSALRFGNVINTFNVFQHFYPYFDVVDVDWDNELTKALMRCRTDKTTEDNTITLEKFTGR